MCHALTADKLHETNVKHTTGFTCALAGVKGIGPRTSKISDVKTVWLFPI